MTLKAQPGLSEGIATLPQTQNRPQAGEIRQETTMLVGNILTAESEHPVGSMRRAMDVLQARWPNTSLDAAEITAALQAAPYGIPASVLQFTKRALSVHGFMRKFPDPVNAFQQLSGHAALHPIRWRIQPQGVCFIGHPQDLKFLNERMGMGHFAPSGIAGVTSTMPEYDAFIVLYSSESETPEEGAVHELAHAYISTTPIETVYRHSEKKWGTTSAALSEPRAPENLEPIYAEVLEGYANGMLKHEMLARFWAAPDELLSEMPQKGPLDSRYVFDSFSYCVPDPYQAITLTMPPKHEKTAAMYAARRAEMNLPLSDKEFTPDQVAAVKALRQDIRQQYLAVREPYRIAYEQSVVLLKQGLARGLPLLDLIDVVIATSFLRLPEALSKLAA